MTFILCEQLSHLTFRTKLFSLPNATMRKCWCFIQDSSSNSLQVSWLRFSSVEVLSVGDLVFSSDSRVSVYSLDRRWQDVQIWILKIRRVSTLDQGLYQCQVKYMLNIKGVWQQLM